MNWRAQAKHRWPKAAWIDGDGPYASLAHCRELTVRLYPDQASAQRGKDFIDRLGCGGACYGHHEIVKIQRWAATSGSGR
jgi:hypothetical protein